MFVRHNFRNRHDTYQHQKQQQHEHLRRLTTTNDSSRSLARLHDELVEKGGHFSPSGSRPALLDEVQANAAEVSSHAGPRDASERCHFHLNCFASGSGSSRKLLMQSDSACDTYTPPFPLVRATIYNKNDKTAIVASPVTWCLLLGLPSHRFPKR